jgi:endo-1,4-beta-xylanase
MAADGSLAPTVWRRFIGADYVAEALRTARAANPRAKLFINDFAVESPGPKLEGLLALVRDLKARRVPLDGIGLQAHFQIAHTPDEATLTSTIRSFERMGLEVQITEMDVGMSLLGIPEARVRSGPRGVRPALRGRAQRRDGERSGARCGRRAGRS